MVEIFDSFADLIADERSSLDFASGERLGIAQTERPEPTRCYGNEKGVTIPDSVIGIGDYAFSSCPDLKSVIFKNVEGWSCSIKYSEIDDGVIIYSSDFGKLSLAAVYLTDNYYKSGYWKRG